jgi:ribosomal small subunit protein bTHX
VVTSNSQYSADRLINYDERCQGWRCVSRVFFGTEFGKFLCSYYTCCIIKLVFMGRGDKKSKKGKRTKGSYGKTRNRKAIKARIKRAASKKPAAAKAEGKAKPARKVAKKAE